MAETLLALKDASLHEESGQEVARLEQVYARELSTYTVLVSSADGASSG